MSVVYSTGGSAVMELETLDGFSVRVTISGVASTTTFTLTRLCEGVTLTVPGWRAKQFVDTYVYTDSCVPLNRPVTYALLVNGVIAASATITLSSSLGWLQDPLQPNHSVPVAMRYAQTGAVTLDESSLRSFTFDAKSSAIQVMGAKYPAAFGGQRQGAAGVNVSFSSNDQDTADAVEALFMDAPIVLYRPADRTSHLPALSYILAKVEASPFDPHEEDQIVQWAVTGDLVAAVMQAPVSGAVTYDDVQQLLAGFTYDQVQALAASTTYLDWQKNPLIVSTL